MNKEIAKKIMNELIKSRSAIDSAEVISREIEDENLRKDIRKILGKSSLDLYSVAMGKIINRYPELDPYSMSDKWESKKKNSE